MILRTALYASFFGGMLCVILPLVIIRTTDAYRVDLGAYAFAGFLPLACGIAMCIWCVAAFATVGKGTSAPFEPPRTLVVSGLFRFTRNPMYIGGVLILLGESLLASSWLLLVYAAVFAVAAHLFVLHYEEPALRRKFGQAYEEYMARTPRWLIKGATSDT